MNVGVMPTATADRQPTADRRPTKHNMGSRVDLLLSMPCYHRPQTTVNPEDKMTNKPLTAFTKLGVNSRFMGPGTGKLWGEEHRTGIPSRLEHPSETCRRRLSPRFPHQLLAFVYL